MSSTASVPAAAIRPAAILPGRHLLALVLAVGLFEGLFWERQIGLNGLLYMVFAVAAQGWYWPGPRQWPFWVAAGGALLSGGLMACYGSLLAALTGWVSVALLLAFARLPTLRTVHGALLTTLANLWLTRPALQQALWPAGRLRGFRGWYHARLLLLPMAMLGLFHLLFASANPRYEQLSEQWLSGLRQAISRLGDVSGWHVVCWLLAVVVATALLLRGTTRRYALREARQPDILTRQRRPGRRFFPLPALRRQYLSALLLFGMLNALLLVVNIIDVNWLWLHYQPATTAEMKQFVHEGTYALTFSILLAMSLVLWAFRGNLNFYAPGLRQLRVAATAWVLQNALLALSVGLRNYYYIVATGLAYRRIGVCAFLALTLFGLGTVGLKVWQRRSAHSLLQLNGWAAYALLLLLAAGNWEVWMVRYNVQRSRRHIDLSFLLALPGRTLPAMQARRAVLAAPGRTSLLVLVSGTSASYRDEDSEFALRFLAERTHNWRTRYREQRSWQSWNYADWQAYQQLPARDAPPRE